MVMLLAWFIMMLISMLLILVPLITSTYLLHDREQISPFECGFDPKNSSRMPFSLQFFLITIIFLIFDVEITLLLPIPIILMTHSSPINFIMITMFLWILLLGLYYEWYKGALNWII